MALNPVERRLLYLCNHWSAFTGNASKRLLLWQMQDNAVRIVQGFFEVQKHQTDFTTGDMFIVFDTPFENSIQYSRALKEMLVGRYQASHDDLRAEGITPDWVFDPATVPHSVAGFVESMRSFGSHHQESIGLLVAVLMPSQMRLEAYDAFGDWLARALAANLPGQLRLVVVDSVEHPRLGKLTAHPLVYVDAPEIDAFQTAQESFAQEGVGPAAVFSSLLMALMTLVERAPADQAKAKAADATAFARQQGWVDQEAAVAVMLSGAFLKEKRFDEALQANDHAREMAQKAVEADHPAGRQLVMQTWFGEAGIHFAAGDLLKAADAYQQAGILAQDVPNAVLAVEGLRMEAFCRSRAGHTDAAIQAGQNAIALGSHLQPDLRLMSTLPIAALDLLRMLDARCVERMEKISNRAKARESDAFQALERQAAKLENRRDLASFDVAETQYTNQLQAAQQTVDQELLAAAGGGNRRFVEAFENARQLLGPQWPMAALAMLAPPGQP